MESTALPVLGCLCGCVKHFQWTLKELRAHCWVSAWAGRAPGVCVQLYAVAFCSWLYPQTSSLYPQCSVTFCRVGSFAIFKAKCTFLHVIQGKHCKSQTGRKKVSLTIFSLMKSSRGRYREYTHTSSRYICYFQLCISSICSGFWSFTSSARNVVSEMPKKTKCLRPHELRFSFLQLPLPGRELV